MPYRISNYRWIYEYGMWCRDILLFGSLGWSLLHPLIIWSEFKTTWKRQIVWILIGTTPILYLGLMMIIIN